MPKNNDSHSEKLFNNLIILNFRNILRKAFIDFLPYGLKGEASTLKRRITRKKNK